MKSRKKHRFVFIRFYSRPFCLPEMPEHSEGYEMPERSEGYEMPERSEGCWSVLCSMGLPWSVLCSMGLPWSVLCSMGGRAAKA